MGKPDWDTDAVASLHFEVVLVLVLQYKVVLQNGDLLIGFRVARRSGRVAPLGGCEGQDGEEHLRDRGTHVRLYGNSPHDFLLLLVLLMMVNIG